MNSDNLKLVTELRHELHSHPELSMHETWTKQHLMDFLKQNTGNLEIVDGGRWFYAVYRAEGKKPAGGAATGSFAAGGGQRNIAFRADFDALPIEEPADLIPYASTVSGVSHKCGHDGHAASLAGLALEIDQNGADKDVYFLFQHAEETGEGAVECASFIADNGIEEIFAFHNLSGYPKGWIVTREGTMNCASRGATLEMIGSPTHASMPENGINPAYAIAEVTRAIPELIRPEKYKGIVLCTVIQIDVGQLAFGTAASKGVLRITERAQYEDEMNAIHGALEAIAAEQAQKYGLKYSWSYCDYFPETANAAESVDKIRRVCRDKNVPLIEMPDPLRPSEDFGHLLKLTKGADFGVGIGEDHTPLHTTNYDFCDDIIETAVDMYKALIEA